MKHTARQKQFESDLSSSDQYTFVTTIGNSVYARARRHDGAPVYVEKKYTPIYFLPTSDPSTTHRGYDGTLLVPHMCDNLRDAKEFLEEHPDAYGDIQPEYMLLSDTYGSHDVAFDIDRLYIWNIDIEVDRDTERGFAPVEDPFSPVTAITVIWRHMGAVGKVVYGTKDYTPIEDELYIKCDDERDMLRRFIKDFRSAGDYPDVVTGWNVQFYDIPYLVGRVRQELGNELVSQLSPFQRMAERRVILNHREQLVIDIKGIAILDYLELYRKFTLTQQESYRLDHIAHVELKKRKLSYAEYRSLDRLYRENHQKFIEYNLQDVKLVDELDQKLKLIELVCALAYGAKSNFADTFKQVRLWDIMIYHKLRSLSLQVPPRKHHDKDEQYAGAFVKEPIVGHHDWVVSFDVASMYPHIIREWNLSPETLIDQVEIGSVEDLLDRKVDIDLVRQGEDVAVAGNGVLTSKEQEGFLPNMLKTLYDERVKFKKLANKAKQELETETDPERRKQLAKDMAAYNNQQQVRKVNLNSAYGALGSNYFRFYDTRLAEAVTITGQLTIRWVAKYINDYLNRVLDTKNIDYVIASDTDSVYLRLGRVAEKMPKGLSTLQMVKMFDQFCNQKIQPIINQSFVDLAEYLNVYIPCLSMVRDVIADKGVWTAKKRYILNVHNSEGVQYEKPKLKMMGIEAIKSSTPAICREMITESLKKFMTGTQEDVWEYVKECRARFEAGTFEDVAWPRSVNGLKKYSSRDKGVPIHVRGALAFNGALERTGLGKQHEPIHEGEKIRFAYLREPNPFFTNVMSAPQGCPPEWNIEQYIDYHQQFEKTFIEPLDAILKHAGWSVNYEPSLF